VHPTEESNRDAKRNWKLPFRTGPDAPVNTRALVAIAAALSGGRGGVEGLGDNVREDVVEWTDAMLEAAPDDLFGAREDGEMSSNTLTELGRRVVSTLWPTGAANETMGAATGTESGTPVGSAETPSEDPRGNGSAPGDSGEDSMTNREELIDAITSNSAIKRESLEGMGDTCLETTHENVVGNTDGGDGGDGDDGGDGGSDAASGADGGAQTLADMTVDDLADGLAERGFVTEDDLGEAVANAQQQSEKEQRVERIIANSAEYDADDKPTLLETPESVLEDIEAGLSSNATLPGATGAADRATANATGGDDPSEYSDGTIGGDL
jgi:hypothetical protein